MKSFYRFAENNVLVKPQKEMDEIKKEDFMGIKSVERFLKLLHITVKQKEKPVVPLLSQEDLHTLVNKLNNGDTGKEIVSDPALLLNFRTRQINMSEELSVIKNGSSNQIMYLLMKWFDQDLPIIAQLVEKTKIRRYDEDFLKNVTFTHKEIDRLVISNEMKAMCSQSYDVLTQFNRFVEYYCSIKNEKDLLSRFRVSCLPLHGIDTTTDE
ncbi:hypothetical protein KAZ66_03890 [Candidatus Woesebacteria bacterium]|nr:hypothetical protein [Candidatus Woesebacteria bacterium]